MRAVLLALMLMPNAALANDPKTFISDSPLRTNARAGQACQNARVHNAAKPLPTTRMTPLAQEPAANAYLPVMRLKDGCDLPVMVREAALKFSERR